MNNIYLFTSARLGFRNWTENDLDEFATMNADPEVMEHFPKALTRKESEDFITRLQKHFDDYGYTYYAVEVLNSQEFIGFIGFAYKEFEAEFTPATDIGWRLKKSAWGKGYSTEGAKRCLEHGFNKLKLNRIISTCPIVNVKSENVMKKIGMQKKGEFHHPLLKDFPTLEKCLWYEIQKQ